MLGMSLDAGGHLTHGFRPNISGKLFEQASYGTDPETGLLDYDAIAAQAREFRPLILLAGYSAYPRTPNFRVLREIADEVGATLMVDMAHFAGLVAGGVLTGDLNPVPHAEIVTSTTHKSLRGPRGGFVLCTGDYAALRGQGLPDGARRPAAARHGGQGGRVRRGPAALLRRLRVRGSSPTPGRWPRGCCGAAPSWSPAAPSNHIVLLDVGASFGLTGRQAESALLDAGVVTNRNSVPRDPNGAWYTSGIRLGTPALTTLGFGPAEMDEIAEIITAALRATAPAAAGAKAKYTLDHRVAASSRERCAELLSRHPLYPGIQL